MCAAEKCDNLCRLCQVPSVPERRGRKFSEVFIACVENIDLSLFLVRVSFTVSQVFIVLIEIKFHISYVRVSL